MHVKPTSRTGYFLVGRPEITLINERLGKSSTSAKAVWLALVQLSSERKDPPDFDVEVALITHLAGLSHRATQMMIAELEKLGLLTVTRHPGAPPKGNVASTYQLHRQGLPGKRSQKPVKPEPGNPPVSKETPPTKGPRTF